MLYPFIIRDLAKESCWTPEIGPASDIVSPYGYGGAFCWGARDVRELSGRFWGQFDEWAAGQGVVSEFVRFSLFTEELLDYPGEKEERLLNVVRSLATTQDEMWMEFEHKVRKNVKRARSCSVGVRHDARGDCLDDFLEIYTATMDRRGASAGYFFPRSYFCRLHETLAGQFAYFHAYHGGRCVSSELVLVSAESAYSFLGGTDEAAFHLRPNELLKLEIIGWAKQLGKKWFVLGGGSEPGDGIFRYKRSFAPNGIRPFFVGRRILCEHAYESLLANRREQAGLSGLDWKPRCGYFPAYRS